MPNLAQIRAQIARNENALLKQQKNISLKVLRLTRQYNSQLFRMNRIINGLQKQRNAIHKNARGGLFRRSRPLNRARLAQIEQNINKAERTKRGIRNEKANALAPLHQANKALFNQERKLIALGGTAIPQHVMNARNKGPIVFSRVK